VTRSWPNVLHHVFLGAAWGKNRLSRSCCDVGELGFICGALSSAAVAGSLVSWQPCPVHRSLVEKQDKRSFSGG